MQKTNVHRLLDGAGIPYASVEYEVDENDLSGVHAAELTGIPAEQVFKTRGCQVLLKPGDLLAFIAAKLADLTVGIMNKA